MGAVLIVLLAAGAVALWARDGTDGATGRPGQQPPRALHKAWERTDGSGAEPVPLKTWRAGDVFVDRLQDGVHGFDSRTGDELWKLRPPPGAGPLCAMSDMVNGDGIGGALFMAPRAQGGTCSLAAGVDAKSGEVLWKARLGRDHAPAGDPTAPGTTTDIAAGPGIVTFNTRQGPARFTAARGKRLAPLLPEDEGCPVSAASSRVSGRYAALTGYCPPGSAAEERTEPDELRLYDLQSGRRLSGAADYRGTLIADEPLTLLRRVPEEPYSYLDTYDASGRPLQQIRLPSNQVADREGLLHISDGVAAVPTEGDLLGWTVGTAAVDLRTGDWLWRDQGSKKRSAAYPVGIDGDRVLAVSDGPGDEGAAELYAFGLRDGKREFAGRVPGAPKAVRGVDVSATDAMWDSGILYLRDATDGSDTGTLTRAFRS